MNQYHNYTDHFLTYKRWLSPLFLVDLAKEANQVVEVVPYSHVQASKFRVARRWTRSINLINVTDFGIQTSQAYSR